VPENSVASNACNHSDKDAQEGKANLPQLKVMVVLKDELKGAKEQVDYA
jgi:hypothetical protein